MHFDATFWATVALLLFFALIIYMKVPGMMTKALDDLRTLEQRAALAELQAATAEAAAMVSAAQRAT